jgi:4-amino-4-deoxy-L-arabinose transferase-like glycosyltransferase
MTIEASDPRGGTVLAEKRAPRLALALLLALTAARLVVAGFVGLGDVEAYYWTWSRHLDLSYYDHPPLVAYLIAATTAIGGDSPFFVRLGPILLTAATAWIVYLLATDLGGNRRTGLRALVLFELIPAFAIGGQGANPDVPLGFFWVAFLWLLWRATTREARALAWPAGLCLGLALLSKYFAVLLGVSAIWWLLRREHRPWWRRPELYGALAIALLSLVPIVLWNDAQDWPSVRYHFSRHGAAGLSLSQAGMFLGGQALYFSPFLWGGLLWALGAASRRGFGRGDAPERRAYAFLATAALPPLLFFTAVGLWTPEFEPHWTAMGYLPLCLAAAMLFPERWNVAPSGRRTAFRVYAWAAAVLPAALIVAVHVHLLTPLFVPLVPERDRPRDLMTETTGWPEVGRRAEEIARRLDRPFLLHYHYTKCGQLAFAVRNRLPVVCLNDRLDQFDFWQNEAALVGRDALYVTDSVYARRPEEVWRFDRCEAEPPLEIRRGGYLLRRFSFWRCYGYRGPVPGRKDL